MDALSLESALAREVQLLTRLIYKNKNQHRLTKHFQSLQQVHKLLKRLLSDAPVTKLLLTLEVSKEKEQSAGDEANTVSSHNATLVCSARAQALENAFRCSRHLCHKVMPHLISCARHLLGLVSQGFFLTIAVTLLCLLGRCRQLIIQILCRVISRFNALAGNAEAQLEPKAFPRFLRLTKSGDALVLDACWEAAPSPLQSSLEGRATQTVLECTAASGHGEHREHSETGVMACEETADCASKKLVEDTASHLQEGDTLHADPAPAPTQAPTALSSSSMDIVTSDVMQRAETEMTRMNTSRNGQKVVQEAPNDPSREAAKDAALLPSLLRGATIFEIEQAQEPREASCSGLDSTQSLTTGRGQGEKNFGEHQSADVAAEQQKRVVGNDLQKERVKKAMLDLGFDDFLADFG